MATATDMPRPEDASAAANMRCVVAADLFRDIPQIAEDMAGQPLPGQTAPAFLRQLLAGVTPEEAVTFAAYALRPRHSVWWAHECLQSVTEVLVDEDRRMLELCAQWAADPTEPNRRRAIDAGMAATARGPGVWIALGAGWSGGSMAPTGLPDVAPPLFLTGRAVNAGVLSALARVAREDRRRRLAHFVGMAEVLARAE